MSFNIFKLTAIFFLGSLLAFFTHCGKPSPLQFENGYYTGPLISYDAFKSTVWSITRSNCVSCHSEIQPMHASDDVKEAHDAAIMKVNFANIPTSRLVAKLRDENHNCWSDCSANAQEMQRAVEEWARIRSTVDNGPIATDYDIYTRESDTLENEFSINGNPSNSHTVKINVDSAMLKAPMVRMPASDGNYLTVPTTGVVFNSSTDANAGVAYMNFQVPVTGQYRLWGLLHGPSADDNTFFANITYPDPTPQNPNRITSAVGSARSWDINPVNTRFEWRTLNNVTATLNKDVTYTFEFRQREDGVRAQGFVVTADPNFNGQEIGDFFGITLSYDLSGVTKVPGTLFKIDVVDYDLYSYKLSRPRIVSSTTNFKVKNLKVFINDQYNPQHSTYTIVDKVTSPTDGLLSEYAMVVIKDRGPASDKLKFSFEEIYQSNAEASTGGNGGNTGSTNGQDSLTAYQATVYPISRSSAYSCVGCHMNVGPRHASDNPQTAHDATLNVVNFNNPSDSRIVRKMREERHNCGANCDNIANQYESAITQWRTRRQ